MRILIFLLIPFSVLAYDYDDIRAERDFSQYRYEEQARFEYEQDRADRYEWRERGEFLDQQHDEIWAPYIYNEYD